MNQLTDRRENFQYLYESDSMEHSGDNRAPPLSPFSDKLERELKGHHNEN